MPRVVHFEIHAEDPGHFHDTENNVFGIHPPDPDAA